MKNYKNISINELNTIINALQVVKRIAMGHYEDNHDFFTVFYHNAEELQNECAGCIINKQKEA